MEERHSKLLHGTLIQCNAAWLAALDVELLDAAVFTLRWKEEAYQLLDTWRRHEAPEAAHPCTKLAAALLLVACGNVNNHNAVVRLIEDWRSTAGPYCALVYGLITEQALDAACRAVVQGCGWRTVGRLMADTACRMLMTEATSRTGQVKLWLLDLRAQTLDAAHELSRARNTDVARRFFDNCVPVGHTRVKFIIWGLEMLRACCNGPVKAVFDRMDRAAEAGEEVNVVLDSTWEEGGLCERSLKRKCGSEGTESRRLQPGHVELVRPLGAAHEQQEDKRQVQKKLRTPSAKQPNLSRQTGTYSRAAQAQPPVPADGSSDLQAGVSNDHVSSAATPRLDTAIQLLAALIVPSEKRSKAAAVDPSAALDTLYDRAQTIEAAIERCDSSSMSACTRDERLWVSPASHEQLVSARKVHL